MRSRLILLTNLCRYSKLTQPCISNESLSALSTSYANPFFNCVDKVKDRSSWSNYRFFATERSVALQRLAASAARRKKLEARKVNEKHVESQQENQQDVPVEEPTTAVVPSTEPVPHAMMSNALNHQALIITRPIEWGTVIIGYEQANKYQVFDQDGTLVALIAEDITGLGNSIARQMLRTRRSFTATVFSPDGSHVLFRVRRPMYLISSTMFIEGPQGEAVGEVHQRWHLLKRNYDLYIDKKQFSAISSPMLAWDFELKDGDGKTLALIDRNFSGFTKEIFTDAGKYVVHFGSRTGAGAQPASTEQQEGATGPQPPAATAQAVSAEQPPPPSSPPQQPPPPDSPPQHAAAAAGSVVPSGGDGVIASSMGNQLAIARPLELSERMIALGAAVAIDYDFFSRHSGSHGFFPSFFFFPGMGPYPSGGEAAPAEPAGPAGGDVGGMGAAPIGGAGAVAPEGMAAGSEGGFGTDSGFSFPGDAESGAGPAWGQDSQEIQWDLPSMGDGGGGDDGEEHILMRIFRWISGD